MTHTRQPILAQPFLKWAGGKGQLLDQYAPYFPASDLRAYFEPFVGSGAVFFHLRGRAQQFTHYHLSDSNAELINCYCAVRDHVDALIARLAAHRDGHSREYYYRVRGCDRDPAWGQTPAAERAARMIYLNKTCYNGLWRVNRKGYFNVPIGRYKNPDILREERLRAASCVLQGVTLAPRPFEAVCDHARPGDFVYFDPPYVPLSTTSNFTSYSADSFGADEQRRLAQAFAALDRQGCRVMLSNSDTDLVHELYRSFRIEKVAARRLINSKGSRRGMVPEVVVLNY